MHIAEAKPDDAALVLRLEREAFAPRSDVADLVSDLLVDPTARPLLSLLAWQGEEAVGHILFTAARLLGADDLQVAILAPLAVAPPRQRRWVGGALIERGIERLAESGVDLVFVLGHPSYYPRHGFIPAIPLGLQPPYAVSPEEAWMVRPLRADLLGRVRGTVACADALAHPEHWEE